jgi:hypothetical protein
MEKILVILDGAEVNTNTIKFASYLARLTHSRLSGIFVDNPEPVELQEIVIAGTEASSLVVESLSVKKTGDEMKLLKEDNVKVFQEVARKEGVEVFIDPDELLTSEDVIQKTRYVDLLVIDANTQFYGMEDGGISSFVKESLQDAECPVIIAPAAFESIDNIVFCYNGIKSSVFAMKQFMYLFPQLTYKRAKVLNLNPDQERSAQEEKSFSDWLKYHYKDVEFMLLNDDAIPAFFNYLTKKRNDFVVMGSFGKGLLGSFFESDADGNTRINHLPLFVAHY